MKLNDLIGKLQNINDRYCYSGGEDCEVEIANGDCDILDTWSLIRICFFEDEGNKTVILVTE